MSVKVVSNFTYSGSGMPQGKVVATIESDGKSKTESFKNDLDFIVYLQRNYPDKDTRQWSGSFEFVFAPEVAGKRVVLSYNGAGEQRKNDPIKYPNNLKDSIYLDFSTMRRATSTQKKGGGRYQQNRQRPNYQEQGLY